MEKVVVGPLTGGLRNDVKPFNIDNDSFPVLINAFQQRDRVKRKRGTSLLNRLKRYFNSTSTAYSTTATIAMTAGAANILTGFSLQTNGNIVPGSVIINNVSVAQQYTDPAMDGTLTGNLGGSGTINYATGAVTILGGGGQLINAAFNYYPDLPVMGLEDLILLSTTFPNTLGFDTKYSYKINNGFPYNIYDVSFYKNPAVSASLPGYTPKTTPTSTSWNGQDYQQFWTVNYQGALWATNGITIPFVNTNIGMQYKAIVSVTVLTPTTATLQITAHGLVVGDFVFVNEVATTTGINFQTGYVTTVTDVNNVIVTFPNAALATNGTGGIAQYLTNRSDITKDCIRFYDGDPTDGNATTPTLNGVKGWVNFCPPLSEAVYSIADLPEAQYYLAGARIIIPFKDRLLFIGPVVQTSTAGSQVYLQDTVIYCQNGTPYYTASFTENPSVTSPQTQFFQILVPDNQTATPNSYFEDVTGFGGFQSAGVDQKINTVGINSDVILIGFDNLQTRFVYTGNDVIPFQFYVVNAELGSGSTFSSITMDQGVLSLGSRGFVTTSQTAASRFDLDIPDEIFQIRLKGNGTERVCAQRDFINEWCYFTYPTNEISYNFPTQTLQYNYRDNTWGVFRETYTTHGLFRRTDGRTWANIGEAFPTWSQWTESWNAGSTTVLQPEVISGNQQGFVLFRDEGTGEGNSLYIRSISGSTITVPDHCLNVGDYITISGCIGTISTELNGKIFSVSEPVTQNTFVLNPAIGAGTYVGGGVIKRMYVPFIQTKQFPISWAAGRKTRIGSQKYLLTTTARSQITLLMYLSQDSTNPYNSGSLVPNPNTDNSGLIYSTVLYTCPESSNLGLTPFNTNLQMISNINSSGTDASSPQAQIWHRVNTSLIGDTVQLAFTMSDSQMRDEDFTNQFEEIEIHGFVIDVSPSQVLA